MRQNEQDAMIAQIFREFESGRRFKSGLGEHGLYEQNRRNERFYAGDQWHGAKCGGDRPLVRHNVIKRIGEYKTAIIGSSPLAVSFSADGIPHTVGLGEQANALRDEVRKANADGRTTEMMQQFFTNGKADGAEIELIMAALSEYFTATANRLRLEEHKEQVLRDAYIGGTGFLYTYWDADVQTGLYADIGRETAIKGDIAVETLDVENVYFGDPNTPDVQKQPYILIAQRRRVEELRDTARRYGMAAERVAAIVPDTQYGVMAGDRADGEPHESRKATVITRLWKQTHNGVTTVKAVQVCKGAVVRPVWDLGVRLYPLAMFTWEHRKNCAYGDSEITYLIPNQIAINRMITASVWAVMMMGIPMTVVNGDVVQENITNDPGQVLRVYGSAEDVLSAVRYVEPPSFSPQFDQNIAGLISNTMSQAGANDAALGNVRPDNTSAIVAVREAATMPMQPIQNRFYRFIGDVARIWAEFWVMKYGARCLKTEAEDGVWYMPFRGERYRDLIISVKVDVGASTLWGEAQTLLTLDNLLDRQIITPEQYVARLPHGVIPKQQSLLRDMATGKAAVGTDVAPPDAAQVVEALDPLYREKLESLPPEDAIDVLKSAVPS